MAAAPGPQLLFVGRALNFALTTDQELSKLFPGANYVVSEIVAVRKSGGASVACTGGVYDAASKGGNAIVAATQSWLTLAAGKLVKALLAAVAGTDILTAATLYLSLTTGSTAAVTADLFVYGYNLDL